MKCDGIGGDRMNQKLSRGDVENILSLTPLQKNMLYQYLLEPNSDEYFEQACYHLEGDISKEHIIHAWRKIINRFPMLRVVYRWDGLTEPVQIVLKEDPVKISWEHSVDEINVEELLSEDKKEKFQLDKGGIRIRFIQQSETEAMMLVTNHHILFDGWSNAVILKEFLKVYKILQKNETVSDMEDKCFEEFVYYLKQCDKELQGIETFKKMYASYDNHYKSPLSSTEKGMRRKEIALPDTIMYQMLEYVKKNQLTAASFIYAVYAMSIAYLREEYDISINVTTSGRSVDIKDIEESVGLYINVVPIRITVNTSQRVLEFTREVRENLNRVEDYKDIGMQKLQQESGIEFNMNQYSVIIQNYPMDKELFSTNSTMKITLSDRSYTSTSELALGVRAFHDEYMFDYAYNSSIISDEFMNQFAECMFFFIAYIVDMPLDEFTKLTIGDVFEKMKSGEHEQLYSKMIGKRTSEFDELEEMMIGEIF